MKKLIFFILGLVCAATIVHAQSPPEIRPLHIGDTVPDVLFSHMLNYKNTTARLSDFRGKLVILDFWETWCGSCIEALPELDRLQHEFGNSIEIIAVTTQDQKTVTHFINNNKIANKVRLIVVTNDILLSKLFPHHLVPHEVWISEQGVVKAITDSRDVTAANIKKVLNGSIPKMGTKYDLQSREPLLSDKNFPKEKLVHYSILLKGYIPGLQGSYRYKISSKSMFLGITNRPILDIYKMIARKYIPHFDNKKIIIEVSNRNKIEYTNNNYNDYEWVKENLYSYEIVVPIKDSLKIYAKALNDLNIYSGYWGRIEERKLPCLILSKKDLHKKSLYPAVEESKNIEKETQGISTYSLLDWFNKLKYITLPVVDEANYKGMLPIDYTKKPSSFDTLQIELSKYNLELVPGKRRIKVLVLGDYLQK